MAEQNRNGIGTGGTSAQNDMSIGVLSIPSEFQPRMAEQNRNGIGTGGTPGLRMTALFWAVSSPSELPPRRTNESRHVIDTGGTPERIDKKFQFYYTNQ